MKKLTPEEQKEFDNFRIQINQHIFELGQICIQLYNIEEQQKVLEKTKADTLKLLQSISEKEQSLAKELEKKYEAKLTYNAAGEINLV